MYEYFFPDDVMDVIIWPCPDLSQWLLAQEVAHFQNRYTVKL